MKNSNLLTALLLLSGVGIDKGKKLTRQLFQKTGIQRKPKRLPRFWSRTARVTVGEMIRECPGKRHAWFESAIGPVRKPI